MYETAKVSNPDCIAKMSVLGEVKIRRTQRHSWEGGFVLSLDLDPNGKNEFTW